MSEGLPAPAPRPQTGMSIDTLFKIMQRFDGYVGTTHARAPIVLTFNTFTVSAILIKWEDLLASFQVNAIAFRIAGVLLMIVALAALTSLAFVFRVVTPYRAPRAKSAPDPNRLRSLFYFEDVAAFASLNDLVRSIESQDEQTMRADLAAQAYALAQSVRSKFGNLQGATRTILYVQLPAIGLLVLLKLVFYT